MSQAYRLPLAALVALVLLATEANAGPISIGAFSGGETVLDFETVPAAVPPPGPFSIGIATFSENSTGSGAPGWRLLDGFMDPASRILTDNAGISDIVIDFSAPQLRVGLDVGIGVATYLVEFFDSSLASLGTVGGIVTNLTSGPGSEFFAGWENVGGISRVRITETSGDNGRVGGIDDVRFEGTGVPAGVPEPTSLLLLGMGLAAAGVRWTPLFKRRSA